MALNRGLVHILTRVIICFKKETKLGIACCELDFMKDGMQGKAMLQYINQLAAKE